VLKAFAKGSVFGQTYGEGPVRVLWLHGWARSSSDFAVAAAQLASRGVSSIALDLPGFGASPLPEQAGGARHYADLLNDIVAEISSEPLTIVGHSFGGRVGLCFAAQYPDKVHALVLSGTPLLRGAPSRANWKFRLVRRLVAWHLVSNVALERARQRYGSSDYRAASGRLRDIFVATVNESYEAELSAWQGPTILLWGANDTEVPVAVAQRASELLAGNVSVDQIAGVGHLSVTEDPTSLVLATEAALA
jgi:pimeloyl-ACP methyl ester carboxylesterase